MSLVEIESISRVETDYGRLRFAELDTEPGSRFDTYTFTVTGWVLGRSSAAVYVELRTSGAPVWRASVSGERPDVGALYPEVAGAGRSGFFVTASVLGLPTVFDVEVSAVLADGTRVELGSLRVRRRLLRTGFNPTLQPLMLTSLGRTGTNWLLLLLSQHSAVTAYRPMHLEPRIGSYWMQVLEALSQPASYLQGLAAGHMDGSQWWLGQPLLPDVNDWWSTKPDPATARWLGRDHIETLAAFCQDRIDAFYAQAVKANGESESRYFVEKYLPGPFVPALMWELYPEARELILVRDPRDVVCSISAFTTNRGRSMSNGDPKVLDEAFIRKMRGSFVDLRDAWQRRPRAHLLHYEDLILRPDETVAAVLEYLGVESDGPTPKELLELASRTEEERQRSHSTSVDALASIGRWRHELDASLQASCLDAFGDVLEAFGYLERDRTLASVTSL